MSDFLANLVRRGAGLAPIVRSRSAPSPEPAGDVPASVENEAQPGAAPVGAMPIAPMAEPQPVPAPAPPVEVHARPIVPTAGAAPSAVVQRMPDETAGPPTQAPVAPPAVAALGMAPATRSTVARSAHEADPRGRVVSVPQVPAPPAAVPVIERSSEPAERIVDIRREVISTPPPATSGPPLELDETRSIPAAPPWPEVPSSQTSSVLRIGRELETGEIVRAQATIAPETAAIVRNVPSAEPAREALILSLPQAIAHVPRDDEPTLAVAASPPPIPIPVAAGGDPSSEEAPASRTQLVPIVALRSEETRTVERVVELSAAAETVRPRPTIEVRETTAPARASAAPDASMPERIVNVRIGAVEIHAAPSADVPAAPAAPAPVAPPSAGFDEFVRLRTYGPWQW